MCAGRTTTPDGFSFITIPRYAPKVVKEVLLPSTDVKSIAVRVLAECAKQFTVDGQWIHMGARKRLVRVAALNGPCGVIFKGYLPHRVYELDAATGVAVNVLLAETKQRVVNKTKTKSDIHKRQLWGDGSMAVLYSARQAVALIQEAALKLYGDSHD